MLPFPLLFVVLAAWAGWRFLLFVERLLVGHRSQGWVRLLAVLAIAYGLPGLLRARWWAIPVLLIAIDAIRTADWPTPTVSAWLRRRSPQRPDNVVPLRSS